MEEIASIASENLNEQFASATSYVKSIVSKLTKQQKLKFYGFYKQATEGPCTKKEPNWYELAEKQKWEAWSALSKMDTDTAMEKYLELLSAIDPDWRIKPSDNSVGWVRHSCMRNEEENIEDSEKTIFDWVKEKNVDKVKISNENINVNKLDESGLSLLHWAADRGSLEIVKYLIESLKADVNLRDGNGQTPLHFAVSCEYSNVENYLIEAGADVNAKDNDGLSPYEGIN